MTMTTLAADLLDAFAAGQPEWLTELRREGETALCELPFPTGREETWRYTDMRLLKLDDFTPLGPGTAPADVTPSRDALRLAGTTSGGLTVHVDGSATEIALSDDAAKQGIVLTSLEDAVRNHADLLRPRLGALVGASDPFTALSLAAHRGGTFLYVPKGAVLDTPIQSLHWLSASGSAVIPRTVVIVEDGARVVFNDVYASGQLDTPTLSLPVTEMFVGRNARVGWLTWQDYGRGVRHLANVKAHLDRDASLETLLITLGADYSRTWKECILSGEGASSTMLGLYFPRGEQRFEHWTVQDHVAPRTTSDLLYKGALNDTARSVYYGTIRVRAAARGTNAYQANRNITLSSKARADTNPQLEIETNDVRCTHGATVGRVDENQVYYLMTRGLSRTEAERLLVFGFFNEVLQRVTWSGAHAQLEQAIHAKVDA